MPAEPEIQQLYAQWRALTDAERRAIEQGAWENLKGIQAAKRDLQGLIIGAERVSERAGELAGARDSTLKGTFEQLMRMEMDNLELLEHQMAAVRAERANLDRSSSNLRRLHRSYVSPAASAWQSYS
ncbi:MAG: hypothetical protein EXS30_10420 [Pedosphaera sp.]|nr:hypothetical protein [Pedosphaera sp.]